MHTMTLRLLVIGWWLACMAWASKGHAIEPWKANPWYWSHAGQPVLLLGGSDDDNLFQWPEERLIPQLDRIASAGGNYVRNTMSDRKDAGFEVYAFLRRPDGKYDLDQWNPEYWERFDRFLRETARRGIFVQIEVWDRFDFTDNRASDPRRWEDHPFNPLNNVNYTREQTGLEARYPEHPGQNKQPFFYSTPQQRNIVALLKYQEAFVERVLDYSLKYDHVMYCIDNETRAEPQWASYWAEWIRSRANKAGRSVPITEMWDDWDLTAKRHRQTFDHPELYDFVDVSQNNHNSGIRHWNNFGHVRELLKSRPRPINTTKTYGADGNKFGHSDQDAIERFWRHFLGGAASMRFHRPDSGLGINDKAMACLRAARAVEANVPIWNLQPALESLEGCDENEAYAAATSNRSTVVVFFPASDAQRGVELKFASDETQWQVTWIDIDLGVRSQRTTLRGKQVVPPSAGNASAGNVVAVLRRVSEPMLNGQFLEVQGHRAFVYLPEENKRQQPQPWVMYGPTLIPNYPDEHERWLHEQLLDAGIAVAGIDAGEAYGSPQGCQAMDALYAHLVAKQGFTKKLCLLGRSRGGLWMSSWAADHPSLVAAFAGIYPVFDLQSYPGLAKAAPAYGMTETQLSERLDELNPISKARGLAGEAIPVFIIHGTDDTVVPLEANSAALRELYVQAGHTNAVRLQVVEGQGHSFWPGFFHSQSLVDFIKDHAQ